MLGFILDIGVILFFVYMFKKCAAKSQLQNAVESVQYILSAVISVPIGVFLGDFCYTHFFRPVIIERVDSLVKTSADVDTSIDPVTRIMTGMPAMVNNGARIYKTTTGSNLSEINRLLAGNLSLATGGIVDIVARPVIDGILRALFFAIAFAACYQFFKAFYPTIEAYLYNPDRAVVSPTIGLVLGAAKVVVILLSAIAIIQLVGVILPDFVLFRPETYRHSFLYKIFSDNNIIMMFLGDNIVAVQ